jgi:hypothetical protein
MCVRPHGVRWADVVAGSQIVRRRIQRQPVEPDNVVPGQLIRETPAHRLFQKKATEDSTSYNQSEHRFRLVLTFNHVAVRDRRCPLLKFLLQGFQHFLFR